MHEYRGGRSYGKTDEGDNRTIAETKFVLKLEGTTEIWNEKIKFPTSWGD